MIWRLNSNNMALQQMLQIELYAESQESCLAKWDGELGPSRNWKPFCSCVNRQEKS